MKILPIMTFAFAAAWLTPDPQDPSPAPKSPVARPADVESVDTMVAALYDVISGPPGARDWDRLRSLFRPDARLIGFGPRRDGHSGLRTLTVDDYVRLAGPALERDGFFEIETGRDEQRYGDIANVLSGYRIQQAVDDPEPRQRGVNAIQLVRGDGRWWIAGLAFEQESEGGAVPRTLRADR